MRVWNCFQNGCIYLKKMKQTISKSQKNKQILNKLIIDGYYNGSISPERFELTRNHFPNNHRIIGIINNDGN